MNENASVPFVTNTAPQKIRRALKVIIKFGLSGLAVFFVYRKLDMKAFGRILYDASVAWLLLALLFYNLSQWVSAWRLKTFLSALNISISFRENLKLYYIGMFYNLFLPGGIGGDGFKAVFFKRRTGKPVKDIIFCLLLDRGSGFAALLILALALALMAGIKERLPIAGYVIYPLLVLIYPAFWLGTFFLFRNVVRYFLKTCLLGIAVTVVEALAVVLILKALGAIDSIPACLALFFAADIVTMLPVTIGGIGAREMTFLFGAAFMDVDPETGVLLSMVFFMITALSSFIGIFLKMKDPRIATANRQKMT